MWTRAELKARGLAAFKKNYWMCVLAAFLLTIAAGGSGGSANFRTNANSESLQGFSNGDISPEAIIAIISIVAAAVLVGIAIGVVITAFVVNPLKVGVRRFFIINRNDPSVDWRELGFGFRNNYLNIVKILFFVDLYTFLWGLLFVIPGIIKGYEYRMIPNLLAEDPSMDMAEAFATTKKMMTGEKMNVFVLDLSFLGWILVTAFCTCGILGIFYVNPYIAATEAELYIALKGETPAANETYVPYDDVAAY